MALEQVEGHFKPLQAGSTLKVAFQIFNPCYDNIDNRCTGCLHWSPGLMQFNRFELDILDESVWEKL